MSGQFDNGTATDYAAILKEMVESPPGEMDAALVKMNSDFLAVGDFSPLAVWNHYKKALDFTVRYSWGSSFVVKLLDIEPYFDPPPGGYARRDRSIDSAPWRKDPTL